MLEQIKERRLNKKPDSSSPDLSLRQLFGKNVDRTISTYNAAWTRLLLAQAIWVFSLKQRPLILLFEHL